MKIASAFPELVYRSHANIRRLSNVLVIILSIAAVQQIGISSLLLLLMKALFDLLLQLIKFGCREELTQCDFQAVA